MGVERGVGQEVTDGSKGRGGVAQVPWEELRRVRGTSIHGDGTGPSPCPCALGPSPSPCAEVEA